MGTEGPKEVIVNSLGREMQAVWHEEPPTEGSACS